LTKEHGPGITFLAERLGESPDALASDPRALSRAVEVFGREAIEVIRGYASDDPEVRAAAERRWTELAERFQPQSAAEPGDEFRARLQRLLSGAIAQLEELVREVEPWAARDDDRPPH
jgi:hypothetical protein